MFYSGVDTKNITLMDLEAEDNYQVRSLALAANRRGGGGGRGSHDHPPAFAGDLHGGLHRRGRSGALRGRYDARSVLARHLLIQPAPLHRRVQPGAVQQLHPGSPAGE